MSQKAKASSLIMTLSPLITHEHTLVLMRRIYDEREKLSPYHKQFARGVVFDRNDHLAYRTEETDHMEAWMRDKDAVFTYTMFVLNFANLHLGGTPLGFFIGRRSKQFRDEKHPVGLCIAFETKKNDNYVSNRHAVICFHQHTGVLMIKGASATNPVLYYMDSVTLEPLYLNDSQVFKSLNDQLGFGKLRMVANLPDHDKSGYQDFVELRNEAFKAAGFPVPDSRFRALPGKQPFTQVGPAILHTDLVEANTAGCVMAGVHHRTGDALAIKILHVGDKYSWRQACSLIEASFAFPGENGPIQAYEARCHLGCFVTVEEYRRSGRNAVHFCEHKKITIYILYPLAKTDFACRDWTKYSLQFKLQMIRSFLTTLVTMHGGVWTHRSVSPGNTLVMSDDPPRAVCSGLGSAFEGPIFYETQVGDPELQAPEISSGPRTKKVDTWNAGLLICFMLLPEDYDRRVDRNGRQGVAWNAHMVRCLERFGRNGETERRTAEVVIKMIKLNPLERPTVKRALQELPEWVYSKNSYVYKQVKAPKQTRKSDVTTNRDSADLDTAINIDSEGTDIGGANVDPGNGVQADPNDSSTVAMAGTLGNASHQQISDVSLHQSQISGQRIMLGCSVSPATAERIKQQFPEVYFSGLSPKSPYFNPGPGKENDKAAVIESRRRHHPSRNPLAQNALGLTNKTSVGHVRAQSKYQGQATLPSTATDNIQTGEVVRASATASTAPVRDDTPESSEEE